MKPGDRLRDGSLVVSVVQVSPSRLTPNGPLVYRVPSPDGTIVTYDEVSLRLTHDLQNMARLLGTPL